MDWNDGYVSDIDYPKAFFREQSPVFLNFACVLNGYEPVALDKPFTYCELGFGHGLTANILAASNPLGRFYAADFLPCQVAAAQQLAASAQLDNLTLLENSFAELAAGEVEGLPQFDFVTMHGVYTWVNAENRRHIVKFLSRYLKPGGIVYVSYNALPGWNVALPLQRLILEHGDLHPNRSNVQVENARRFVDRLISLEAGYFNLHPSLKFFLDSLKKEDGQYLAHEYMNRGWEPLYHADVARDMAGAKLDYTCSTMLHRAFPKLCLSAERRAMLAEIADPIMRETVTDFMINTQFRQDIFVRGARTLGSLRKTELLHRFGIALTVPRPHVKLPNFSGKEHLYDAMADALADGPKTFKQLAAMPVLCDQDLSSIVEVAAMLTAAEQTDPFFSPAEATDVAAAHRMNRALARSARQDDSYQGLASPLLGNGTRSGLIQRLVYLALSAQTGDIDVTAVYNVVGQHMAAQERRLTPAGESAEAEAAAIADTVDKILELRLPIWRQLGVL